MENVDMTLLIFQVGFVFFLLYVMIILVRLGRVIRLEKRIDRYTLESISTHDLSFFDEIYILLLKYRRRLSNQLKKSKVFTDYSKKYEKYTDKSKVIPEVSMDYIAMKVMVSFIFLIVVLLSDVLWYRSITFYQIFFSLLVGFFIPDLFLISRDKLRNKNMENDLLKAITIMNNAFKSGNSIMQAIYLASVEIEGPIKDEFKKMYIDLSYGLSVEVVFKRFSKRVELDEVKYMTTSLTILNKTGGNIAKVFSSIEHSFFERRKLKQEMKALTSSAGFMFKILIATPFVICSFIVLLNPTYFEPLFTTSLGIMIFTLILVIYIAYIIVVRKVMKVDGVR